MTIVERGVLSYPIPLYQNVDVEPQFYTPRRFVIDDILRGKNTLITTEVDHDYEIGQQIRLIIPSQFGCYQLNEAKGYVIAIPSSVQVLVDIDSSQNVDPYINEVATTSAPQILAIGDINNGRTNACGPYRTKPSIPGSFKNISPR